MVFRWVIRQTINTSSDSYKSQRAKCKMLSFCLFVDIRIIWIRIELCGGGFFHPSHHFENKEAGNMTISSHKIYVSSPVVCWNCVCVCEIWDSNKSGRSPFCTNWKRFLFIKHDHTYFERSVMVDPHSHLDPSAKQMKCQILYD